MTSTAKIEANRRNAQKSTGPKTPEGKAASSRNALRHGLTARQLILFDETEQDFANFHEELRDSHAPADAAEAALVERIAVAHWRLRRVWRAEAGTFNREARAAQRHQLRAEMVKALAAALAVKPPGPDATPLSPRDEALAAVRELSDEQLDAALRADEAAGREPPPGLADIALWPARLAELQRYEASLERTLSRLARDLERAQAARRQRLADAHIAEMARLEVERRAAAIRHELELDAPAADLAKRSQGPAAEDDFPMAHLTIPRLEAAYYAKRTQASGRRTPHPNPPPQGGRESL
jgi:hypothetical protein